MEDKMSIWIGIDVSQDTLDCGWFENGEKYHIQVPNTQSGFEKMISKCPKNGKFVMEATGTYFLNAALFLAERNIHVSVENPIRIKNHMKSDLRRSKSDKSDSFSISKFGAEKSPEAWKPLESKIAELQQLFSLRDSVVNDITRTNNQIHAFTRSKLVSKNAVKIAKKMINSRKKELALIEKEIKTHIDKCFSKEMKILSSIPGVGVVTAGKIIATVDFERFESSRCLNSYLGLTPTTKQSGTSIRGRGAMSKMGGSRLRQDLYFCAISASRHNPACAKLYQRMKEKGKPGKVILVAIMNKIIRQAFAMIKSDSMYKPELA
jgi:transposase